MSILDLSKATITCGGTAFVLYSFPVAAQAITIGVLALLWLSYAHNVLVKLRRH
jgi:hypothetical protein